LYDKKSELAPGSPLQKQQISCAYPGKSGGGRVCPSGALEGLVRHRASRDVGNWSCCSTESLGTENG